MDTEVRVLPPAELVMAAFQDKAWLVLFDWLEENGYDTLPHRKVYEGLGMIPSPEGTLGAILNLGEVTLKIAQNYHSEVSPLYSSKRGRVVPGRGGQEEYCYPYKGKYKTWKAWWKNAGVRVVWEKGVPFAVIENHRGKEVSRAKL